MTPPHEPEGLARWIEDRLHSLGLSWSGIEPAPEVAVVGVDASPLSHEAAARAAEISSEVHLVAGLAEEVPAFVKASEGEILEGWHERARQGARAVLDEVAGKLEADSLDLHLADDTAASAIVDVAEQVGADLVAVGRSSRDRIERLLLGSVADQVAHRAPCSVLVVGQDQRAGPVVVGVGGDQTVGPAVGWGAQMALTLGAKLVLAHAAPERYAPPGYRDVEGEAEALSVGWPPRKELVALAEAQEAQLLVVGHGKRPGWLGSTALGVLHRAQGSVLVAKGQAPS